MSQTTKVLNFEERFNSEFQQHLRETKVEYPIPNIWFERALLALDFGSTLKMGITGNQFLELITAVETKNLTLLEFALLSNNLEERTPRDLGLTVHEYGNFMSIVAELSKTWKELTDVTRDTLLQSIIQEQAVKNNPGLKSVN